MGLIEFEKVNIKDIAKVVSKLQMSSKGLSHMFCSIFLNLCKLISAPQITHTFGNYAAVKLLRAFPRLGDKIDYWRKINWQRTKAFTVGAKGHIYINLVGREPLGTVGHEEYEEVREDICKKLCKITDEYGKKLFAPKRREEIYYGKNMEAAPDIVLGADSYYISKNILSKRAYGRPPSFRSGIHRMNGILILKNSDMKHDFGRKTAQIIDIAPTILHLFGLPIPKGMEGRVLTELFDDSFFEKNPIRFKKTEASRSANDIIPTEEEKIVEQLRALGYL